LDTITHLKQLTTKFDFHSSTHRNFEATHSLIPDNMVLTKTIKQWVVTGTDKGFDGLELQDAHMPKVGDNDVLVKLHAASLNYRDLIIPKVR
jgi:hypothetical protein